MNIVEKKLKEIKPYEKNARKNDDAVKYVTESIRQFGFKVPIVIDKDNVIVAGHTRYKASKELGLEAVPCIVADDLTEEQIKAYRLADNKVSEVAEWDFDLLGDELKDIFDIDMSDFGFGIPEEEEEQEQEEKHNEGQAHSVAIGSRAKVGKGQKTMILHNHPSGGHFSDADLISTSMDARSKGIVATSTKAQYTFEKGTHFKATQFVKAVKNANMKGKSYDDAVDKWLKGNAKKYGYKYTKQK